MPKTTIRPRREHRFAREGAPPRRAGLPAPARAAMAAVLALAASLALAGPAPASAQQADARSAAAGHWEGAIELPGNELAVRVDLARSGDGWRGEVDVPAQGARDVALSDVRVRGDSVTFSMAGVPGEPTFRGTVADGDTARMTGDFRQSGQTFPFSLARTGPAELSDGDAGDEGAGAAAGSAADPLAGFDDFVEGALEDFGVPGAAVAVVRGDSVLLARGYGVRDRDSGAPVTPRTVMPIGSSTKAFTSLLVGTLVEDGELAWDEPVRSWLPEFRLQDDVATEQATPVDLLTHRTGLPRHDLLWYGSPFEREELFRRLRHLEPSAEFRSTFQYNNLMYMTAGLLAGRVADASWEELVRSRILEPLGMDRTSVTMAGLGGADDAATGYREASSEAAGEGEGADAPPVAMDYREIDAMGPAGSINSTVLDMARWIRLQLNGGAVDGTRVADEATVRRTHRPEMVVEGGVFSALLEQPEMPYVMYGLGWFVQPYRGHRMIHHGGNIDGFSARVSFLPDEGAGVVVLSNRNATTLPTVVTLRAFDRLLGLEPVDWTARYQGLQQQVESARRAGGDLREVHRKEGTSPTHPLEDYAGTYRDAGYGDLRIRRGESGLTAVFHGEEIALEHWHHDAWQASLGEPFDLDLLLQFETNRRGDVAALTVPLEGQVEPIRFEKRPPASMSDPDFLRKLTGRYRLMGLTARVERRDGTLTLTVPGQPTYRLEPYRGTEFDLADQAGYSVRFRMEDGRAVEMLMIQPNGVFTAERASGEEDEASDGEAPDGGNGAGAGGG